MEMIFEVLVTVIFVAFLLVISWTDFKTLMIYDKILIPMAMVGIFFDLNNLLVPVCEGLLNSALGFLLMFLIYKLSRGGLGGGDVKFSAVLGIWLGEDLFSAIFLASIFAAVVAVFFLIKFHDTKKELPFGPFLSAGSLIVYFMKFIT